MQLVEICKMLYIQCSTTWRFKFTKLRLLQKTQLFIWNIVNVFWGFQYWCSTYCKILKLGSVFTKPFTFRYFTGYSVELQLTGTNRGKTARQTRKPFFSPTMLSLDKGGQCSKSRKFLKIQGSPVNTVSINAVPGVVRFQIPTHCLGRIYYAWKMRALNRRQF